MRASRDINIVKQTGESLVSNSVFIVISILVVTVLTLERLNTQHRPGNGCPVESNVDRGEPLRFCLISYQLRI